MASSTAIHEILIGHQTVVEPGGEALSAVLDVRGAREAALTLTTPEPNDHLTWEVHFGPNQTGRLVQTAEGSFADSAVAAVVVPVHGVRMLVTVHNRGTEPATVEGMAYYLKL